LLNRHSQVSRILITGGARFIGCGVVKTLAARGDKLRTEWPQVIALVRSRKPPP
jgi:nucleoside-diphosphate-sugar epimerase